MLSELTFVILQWSTFSQLKASNQQSKLRSERPKENHSEVSAKVCRLVMAENCGQIYPDSNMVVNPLLLELPLPLVVKKSSLACALFQPLLQFSHQLPLTTLLLLFPLSPSMNCPCVLSPRRSQLQARTV